MFTKSSILEGKVAESTCKFVLTDLQLFHLKHSAGNFPKNTQNQFPRCVK